MITQTTGFGNRRKTQLMTTKGWWLEITDSSYNGYVLIIKKCYLVNFFGDEAITKLCFDIPSI